MKITLYRVKANNETVGVFKKKHEAEAYAYDEYPDIFGHAVDGIVASIEVVPDVSGELLSGMGQLHVRWLCLFCGEYHDTDLTADDTSPALWFCERNGGSDCFCLVRF